MPIPSKSNPNQGELFTTPDLTALEGLAVHLHQHGFEVEFIAQNLRDQDGKKSPASPAWVRSAIAKSVAYGPGRWRGWNTRSDSK